MWLPGPAHLGDEAADEAAVEVGRLAGGEVVGQHQHRRGEVRDALAAAAQQVPQQPLLDVEDVVGPLRQVRAFQPLEHLGVAAQRAADGVFRRVVPLADHLLQLAAEPGVLEHLQVGLEDGAVLLAQLLGDGVAVAGDLRRRRRAIALSSRSSSSSTASRETNRRGMRNPSLSITSASPMATPGETAIPCSFCMRSPSHVVLVELVDGTAAASASSAARRVLGRSASSDSSSPWAAPSDRICSTSVASTRSLPLTSVDPGVEAARAASAIMAAARACMPARLATVTVRVTATSDMTGHGAASAGVGSGAELVVVGLVQQLLDVFRRLGLLEEAAEGVVAELPRDVLQRPQVVAGPVGRRNQQEEQVDRLAVEAGEIDPRRG